MGHKVDKCKLKEKINEICAEEDEIKNKLITLLINEKEQNTEDDYYNDLSSSEEQEDCNCSKVSKYINVITKKEDKEFLLDIVEKIDDPKTKNEFLERLKYIILQEDKMPKIIEPFSISKLIDKCPNMNNIRKETTKDLQIEINNLKTQVKQLQNEILELKTKDLEIEARISLIKTIDQPSISKTDEIVISKNPSDEKQYLNTIEKITFQKWYVLVTAMIEDFKETFVALLDSGADQSCIKEELIPTKYYERTNEELRAANGENLQVKYNLPRDQYAIIIIV